MSSCVINGLGDGRVDAVELELGRAGRGVAEDEGVDSRTPGSAYARISGGCE